MDETPTPNTPHHQALSLAIDRAGGQVALADKIRTSQSNVWHWLKRSKRGAPAEYVMPIEEHTGVPRHLLRPDIFPPPEPSPPTVPDSNPTEAKVS